MKPNCPAAPKTTHDGWGGRSHQGKILIVGAVEVQDGRPGRIRLSVPPDFSARSLHVFLKGSVAPGAIVKTGGQTGYPGTLDITNDPL